MLLLVVQLFVMPRDFPSGSAMSMHRAAILSLAGLTVHRMERFSLGLPGSPWVGSPGDMLHRQMNCA